MVQRRTPRSHVLARLREERRLREFYRPREEGEAFEPVDVREVARQAIAQRVAPGVPLILLTGFGDFMEAGNECPPGVREVLAKPVSLVALRDALERMA